ncbi:hypothetical protein AAG570_006918 [Ranatra chinensis]|uniref:Uncharacterized protein n=1 Tax=Ranatra chinensis TaxID=642074 RepID=A0ABD0YW42_9HEMI
MHERTIERSSAIKTVIFVINDGICLVHFRNEFDPCFTCWSKVLWFGLWKRSILYIIFATVLFLKPHRLWLSIFSGVQLLMLAGLYLILTYRNCRNQNIPTAPRLLHSHSPSQEENYDKYDDMTEVLDDSLPTPLITDNLSELEQDTILEI